MTSARLNHGDNLDVRIPSVSVSMFPRVGRFSENEALALRSRSADPRPDFDRFCRVCNQNKHPFATPLSLRSP
jgi:hypothetical protein